MKMYLKAKSNSVIKFYILKIFSKLKRTLADFAIALLLLAKFLLRLLLFVAPSIKICIRFFINLYCGTLCLDKL